VLLEERVDPAILGGLVVQQADVIRDYSVRARLEALRARLN
jgi:F0F1-type ATP synthase delta subunit